MPNVFPILYLSMLAHLILRVSIGGILLYLGIKHIEHREELKPILGNHILPFGTAGVFWFASVELVLSLLFILGLYTQIAALCGMIFSIKMLLMYRNVQHRLIPGRLFYILFFAVSLSLFITGAGAFAIDLPV